MAFIRLNLLKIYLIKKIQMSNQDKKVLMVLVMNGQI